MRILRINNTIVDLDSETAIGIDYSAFDIKDLSKPRVSISNNFSIPKTANNLSIFGNIQDVQSTSTTAYETMTANYWVNNTQFLRNAKVRLVEINERIEILIYEKRTIWDDLKNFYWPDLVDELLVWLQSEKGYPSASAKDTTSTFGDIITTYSGNTEGLILSRYYTGLDSYAEELPLIYPGVSMLLDVTFFKFKGGHFSVYLKTIFEFLEYKYGINFGVNETGEIANAFNDPVIESIYIPIRGIVLEYNSGWYFESRTYENAIPLVFYNYWPLSFSVRDKAGKTASDLVVAFASYFNLIKDEYYSGSNLNIRFYRFDDLENIAPVVDWSNRLSKLVKFKPAIDGYTQNNYIKFGSVFDGGNAYANSKNITISNENLDVNSDILTIDAHIPSLYDDSSVLDLGNEKTFETFIFLVSSGTSVNTIAHTDSSGNTSIASSVSLPKATLYSLNSEYTFYQSAVQYPKYYEVELWLNPIQLEQLSFFSLIYLRELNGSFFLNKISGFNPDKSKQATKVELLRVSDKAPQPPVDASYWVDGILNPWTDGVGNIWY